MPEPQGYVIAQKFSTDDADERLHVCVIPSSGKHFYFVMLNEALAERRMINCSCLPELVYYQESDAEILEEFLHYNH